MAETRRASRETARLNRGTTGKGAFDDHRAQSAVRPVAPATVTPRLRSGSSVSASSSVSPVSVCSGSGSAQRVSAVPADGNTAASATGCSARTPVEDLLDGARGARHPDPAGRDDGELGLDHDAQRAQRGAGAVEVGDGHVPQAAPSHRRRSPATAADSEPCAESAAVHADGERAPDEWGGELEPQHLEREVTGRELLVQLPDRRAGPHPDRRPAGAPADPGDPTRNAERSTSTPSVTASALKECPAPMRPTVWPRSAARRTTADTPLSSSSTVAVGRHCWPPDQFVHTDATLGARRGRNPPARGGPPSPAVPMAVHTGPVAALAEVVRPGWLPIATSTPSVRVWRAPRRPCPRSGRRGRSSFGDLAGGAAAARAERRLPLGVHRGQDQAAEDAEVLEELLLLGGLLGRVGLLPERVTRDGGRHQGPGQGQGRQPRELVDGQQHPGPDLDAGVDLDQLVGLGRDLVRKAGAAFSSSGVAFCTRGSGLSRVSTPPLMKMAASRGRARRRMSTEATSTGRDDDGGTGHAGGPTGPRGCRSIAPAVAAVRQRPSGALGRP